MDETSRQFMMWGGLMITVIIFSAIAFFIITRPGFKDRMRERSDGKDGTDGPGTSEGPNAESGEQSSAGSAEWHADEASGDAGGSGGDGGGD